MKTASRILTIINMVWAPVAFLFGGLWFFLAGIWVSRASSMGGGAFFASISLTMLIVIYVVVALIEIALTEVTGAILLGKLQNATSKSEIIAPAILVLIFCSLLGGIFALCTQESDYNNSVR